MRTDADKPIRTLRDGVIKAAIWKNEGDKGPFYSVQFIRSYRDLNDQWHDTNAFTGADVLRLKRLAGKAYDAVLELRSQDRLTGETSD